MSEIGTLPAAQAYVATDTVLPSGSLPAVSLPGEFFDYGDLHSTTANTTRLTAPVGGIYLVVGQAAFSWSGTGFRDVRINRGSTMIAHTQVPPVTSSSMATDIQVTAIAGLAAGEFVEMLAQQNSGSDLLLYAGRTSLSATWLSPGPF